MKYENLKVGMRVRLKSESKLTSSIGGYVAPKIEGVIVKIYKESGNQNVLVKWDVDLVGRKYCWWCNHNDIKKVKEPIEFDILG